MVLKEQKPAAEPKSRKSWAKLKGLAGAWSDLDTDKMKRDIYKRRHQASASRRPAR